jgi:protein-disulfide isomerase
VNERQLNNRGLMLGMVALGLIFGAGGMYIADQMAPSGLGGADRARVEQVVRDYVLANPELIPEAMQKLQDKQFSKVVQDNRAAITTPFGNAWIGNPKGDVTLVEYYDYNCTYCRAMLPTVERLVQDDPNVRVVFKELPVLAETSRAAARVALTAAAQGKFKPFHDALYAAGSVSAQTIAAAAAKAGIDPAKIDPRADNLIRDNLEMAGRLGMTGTPSWVVGDRVLSGALPYDALKKAIADARNP